MNRIILALIGLILSLSFVTAQENRGFKPVDVVIEGKPTNLYKQSHALIIAESAYNNGWNVLNGVKTDVAEVKKALADNGFNVEVSENGTKELIDKTISEFIRKYGQGVDNRLLIYYAGHGYTVKTSYGEDLGYIVPVDAPNPAKDLAGFQQKAIEMAQIEIYTKRIQSKHALFLFDACFAGSLFDMRSAASEVISYKTTQQVRQFITSGSAEEQVPDQSIFRKQFVIALTTNEADLDKDGYLTGSELGQFLQNKVVNYSYNTQHPQYGKIRSPKLDKGDFVFELKTSSPTQTTVINTVTPPAATGSIELTTRLSGKFYIDGKYSKDVTAGSTYTINDIQTGVRVLSISGTTNWTEKVMVIAGQITRITAEKIITTGTLSLSTQVSGKLYIDDIYRQTLKAGENISLNDMSEGTHVAKINDPLTAKEIWKESFNINIGKTVNLTAQGTVTEVAPASTGGSGSSYTETASGLNIEMVFVQGGPFTMGCTSEQGSDCYDDEKSAHSVTVSNFYIGKYEVTQAQWRAVMGASATLSSPSNFKNCDECPVEQVSWNDIQEFLKKLNAKTGKTYRLPTEAEWEYAARGGSKSRGYKYSGSNDLGSVAWYAENSNSKTHPVGQKSPNELGIYDMSGNVWEWCSDWYGSYSSYNQNNPTGANTGSARVFRGGSWDGSARYCPSASRYCSSPGSRRNLIGFRLAGGL